MQVREAGQGRTKDVRVESMHQETFKHRGGKDDARKDVAQRAKGVGTGCIRMSYDVLAGFRQNKIDETDRDIKKRCPECKAVLRFNGECPKCDAPDGQGG